MVVVFAEIFNRGGKCGHHHIIEGDTDFFVYLSVLLEFILFAYADVWPTCFWLRVFERGVTEEVGRREIEEEIGVSALWMGMSFSSNGGIGSDCNFRLGP